MHQFLVARNEDKVACFGWYWHGSCSQSRRLSIRMIHSRIPAGIAVTRPVAEMAEHSCPSEGRCGRYDLLPSYNATEIKNEKTELTASLPRTCGQEENSVLEVGRRHVSWPEQCQLFGLSVVTKHFCHSSARHVCQLVCK